MSINKILKEVWLVDDDEIASFVYKKTIINSQISQDIKTFLSASQALDQLEQQPVEKLPQIIFLDINMPLMNGWDFLNRFQKLSLELKNKIKIYILSSSVYQEDISRAQNFDEVSDYIVKPLTVEKLMNVKKMYFDQ